MNGLRDVFKLICRSMFVPCIAMGMGFWGDRAAAQMTASSPCRPNASSAEVTDFGAKADASTDNAKPFKDIMAYAARCAVSVVHIPAGTYTFLPHGPAGGIMLPSNLTLIGDGAGKSILQVAAGQQDANFDSLLWARNQDHVEIKGISFIGNNSAVHNNAGRPLNTYGSAITIFLDAAPSTPVNGTPRNLVHFLIADCSFENFNGASWVRVTDYSTTYGVDDIEIRGNRFESREGNAINPADISYPSNAIAVMGSLNSRTALVTNVKISQNSINAAHLKGGIAIWSGVRGAIIVDNTIADAGIDAVIPNDAGAYAITVYHNAYYHDKDHPQGAMLGGIRPDDVHIERNVITRPRSCGMYVASANRVWIIGNKVSGQTDPQNQTLAKGAIVVGYTINTTVTGNDISSSHIGMTLLGGEQFRIVDSNNSISNIPAGGFRIFPARGPPPAFLSKWAAEGQGV